MDTSNQLKICNSVTLHNYDKTQAHRPLLSLVQGSVRDQIKAGSLLWFPSHTYLTFTNNKHRILRSILI